MSELTTLARPYAKAAFEYAQSTDALTDWSGMLVFAATAVQESTFAAYLDNPALTRDQASKAMLTVCGDNLDSHGKNFVRLMAENDRLELLPAVAELFEELKALYEKTVDVDITSAVDLSEAQVATISKRLSEKLGRKVNINSTTDASLLGGMFIRAGDMVIDASVKGKLNDLSDALQI